MKTAMEMAPNVTLVGIVVVFSALVILALVIWLYSKIVVYATASTTSDSNSETVSINSVKASNGTPDEELIAVFTAAIMASMKHEPTCELRVKSFRRIGQSSPAWNTAGRNEYITTRL